MTCYNSELPIGPPGPTGPQGPPGEGGCCVERIYNDTVTLGDDVTINEQTLDFILEQDGQFIELQFDVLLEASDFSSLNIELNGISLCDININDDIAGVYQGIIIITRNSSTTVNIKLDINGYNSLLLNFTVYTGNVVIFNHYLSQTTDPTDLKLTIGSLAGTGGTNKLITSKVLKYNIPYL